MKKNLSNLPKTLAADNVSHLTPDELATRIKLVNQIKIATISNDSTKLTDFTARLRAFDALCSRHVSGVVVSAVGVIPGGREYVAITEVGGTSHEYTVRLGEDAEGLRWGKCNCAAGSIDVTCRHLIAAAKFDSALSQSEIYLPTVAKYSGHLQPARCLPVADAAAAVNPIEERQSTQNTIAAAGRVPAAAAKTTRRNYVAELLAVV